MQINANFQSDGHYSIHFFYLLNSFLFSSPPVNLLKDLLQNCQQMLTEIENYHGCGNKIKDALSNSTDSRLQILAYNEVCPNIEIISQFYNLANQIGLH